MGNSGGRADGGKKGRLARTRSEKFARFGDKYRTLEDVSTALRVAGLESSNLIIGVDMTKSNTWTGKRSFGGRNLHTISAHEPNPYETSIATIAKTLAPFDDDDMIPVYGFGDATTHDTDVFSFNPRDAPFHGFNEVLDRYRNLISSVKLSGPTSFAPIINRAAHIAATSGQYHILVIVADGQVTRPSDTPAGRYSRHEAETVDAIVKASHTPLSVVLIGVGDGPWDMMKEFDDNLPERQFDNFQFVCATDLMKARAGDGDGEAAVQAREARFALHALMEIPEQYKAIQSLGIGRSRYPCTAPKEPPRITRLAPQRSGRHLERLTGSSRHLLGAGGGAGGAAGAGARAHAHAPAAAAAPAGGAGATWACPSCTYVNDVRAIQCVMCLAPRPSAADASLAYAATAPAPAVAATAPAPAPAPAPADSRRLAAELESMRDEMTCAVCLERRKNVVFQCGHQVCSECSPTLAKCPICRAVINTRIKMF